MKYRERNNEKDHFKMVLWKEIQNGQIPNKFSQGN